MRARQRNAADCLCRAGRLIAVLGLATFGVGASFVRAEDAKKLEFFETRIRPVLVEHCYECHSVGAKEVKGNLVVDTAAGLLKGGDSGASLVPGKPAESLLLEAIHFDGLEMPPAGRLPDNVIADFEKWIEMGAPDPRGGDAGSVARSTIDIEAGRKFWAFQPPQAPVPPPVVDNAWPRSEIDSFVLARL
ncbi:MAG: c-type cytochrome domain-containing protein, partial [Planctomycetota bacterium]